MPSVAPTSTVFTPLKVGELELGHRIVLAPLTRMKAEADHTPSDAMVEYYAQRASHPGTLLIAESSIPAQPAGGYPMPGIWTESHISGWKKVVEAVHAKGSFIYLQIMAAGRAAMVDFGKAENADFELVGASDAPVAEGAPAPRPLTVEEIAQYGEYYAAAARAFVDGAGGDGIEVHGAHGCLVDQFLSNKVNNRTDAYGGSAENRARFALEMVAATASAIGASKVGFRIAPYSTFNGTKMDRADTEETFTYLVSALKAQQPDLAYLHAILPRVAAGEDREVDEGESIEPLVKLWAPKPVLIAGGIKPTLDEAEQIAAAHPNSLVVYGRYFISNPDLVSRIKHKIEATPYNRATFYLPGLDTLEGYTTYQVVYGPDGNKLE